MFDIFRAAYLWKREGVTTFRPEVLLFKSGEESPRSETPKIVSQRNPLPLTSIHDATGRASSPAALVSIGSVYATTDWIVTPAGTWPLEKTNVTTADQTTAATHTPAWAIVLVIVSIWFFFLSLLFLLARETRLSGYIAVHIQCGSESYVEQVPVYSDAQRPDVFNRVTYLQGLIGRARAAIR